jgi:hypothetical protein
MEIFGETIGYVILFAVLAGMLYAFYWFFNYMLKGIKKHDEYDD